MSGWGPAVKCSSTRTSARRTRASGPPATSPGHPQFVYVAAKHGALAVENAFDGTARRIDYSSLPRITFTNPTIASAGLTEAQAHEQGIECECRVLELENVPRAIVSRTIRGLVKLVAERDSGRLIGAHLLADGAGDAIHLTAQTVTRDVSTLSCCAA